MNKNFLIGAMLSHTLQLLVVIATIGYYPRIGLGILGLYAAICMFFTLQVSKEDGHG